MINKVKKFIIKRKNRRAAKRHVKEPEVVDVAFPYLPPAKVWFSALGDKDTSDPLVILSLASHMTILVAIVLVVKLAFAKWRSASSDPVEESVEIAPIPSLSAPRALSTIVEEARFAEERAGEEQNAAKRLNEIVEASKRLETERAAAAAAAKRLDEVRFADQAHRREETRATEETEVTELKNPEAITKQPSVPPREIRRKSSVQWAQDRCQGWCGGNEKRETETRESLEEVQVAEDARQVEEARNPQETYDAGEESQEAELKKIKIKQPADPTREISRKRSVQWTSARLLGEADD